MIGLFVVRMSSVAVEMLVGLVHEGSNRSFTSRLRAAVIGGIQIWNSQFAHERFDDGGCDGARHACKRIHVYHPVVSLFDVLAYSGNAQAGFGSHVKREKIIFLEHIFEFFYLVIFFQVKNRFRPFVDLALFGLLVEKISGKVNHILQMIFDLVYTKLFEAQP